MSSARESRGERAQHLPIDSVTLSRPLSLAAPSIARRRVSCKRVNCHSENIVTETLSSRISSDQSPIRRPLHLNSSEKEAHFEAVPGSPAPRDGRANGRRGADERPRPGERRRCPRASRSPRPVERVRAARKDPADHPTREAWLGRCGACARRGAGERDRARAPSSFQFHKKARTSKPLSLRFPAIPRSRPCAEPPASGLPIEIRASRADVPRNE